MDDMSPEEIVRKREAQERENAKLNDAGNEVLDGLFRDDVPSMARAILESLRKLHAAKLASDPEYLECRSHSMVFIDEKVVPGGFLKKPSIERVRRHESVVSWNIPQYASTDFEFFLYLTPDGRVYSTILKKRMEIDVPLLSTHYVDEAFLTSLAPSELVTLKQSIDRCMEIIETIEEGKRLRQQFFDWDPDNPPFKLE